jgi:hypothetical protein
MKVDVLPFGAAILGRSWCLAATLLAAATLIAPTVANARPPFKAFTYSAAPKLQNPGDESLACQDTGVPQCPIGHTCKIYSYTADGVGKPGFGRTNIEVCVLADQTDAGPIIAGSTCSPAAGFAQIVFKKNDSVTVGLIGQTCEFVGGSAVSSIVQDLNITAGPMTGKMSINSLSPQDSDGLLSIYGTRQNPF